jgi:hypothetical protein
MSSSLFMFSLLLIARAVLALCVGASASERLATGLQVLTIASLAELFFFIPSVIPALVDRLVDGDRFALLIPSMPYAALYAWTVGIRTPSITFGAAMAPLALLVALVIAVALYLWPARRLASRSLETQPHQPAGLVSKLVRRAILLPTSAPAVRAVSTFTVTTIFRSRRHRLVVTAYFGLALAIGTVSVIAGSLRGTLSFDRPETSLLAVPLVAIFFLMLGLRAAFAIPSDIDANWLFRLSQPRLSSSADAVATSLVVLSVVPVTALAGSGAMALGWTTHDVLVLAMFDVSSGCVLAEWTLRECRSVPFTCTRSDDVESLKSRWLARVVPLLVFTFANAAIQKTLLESPRAAVCYVGAAVAACSAARVKRHFTFRNVGVQFDVSPSDSMATLDLSEAIV